MAKAFTCDGCGTPITEADMTELGFVLKSQYCKTCGPLAQKLLDDISAMHTRVAERFTAERRALLAEFRRDNRDFRELPDNLLQFAPIPGENTDV